MLLNRVAQIIIVLVVLAVYDFLVREVLLVAVLGTYEIHGADWLWFYGALAVMSACLVALMSRAPGSIGPREGLIFGALMGGFFGMGEFKYLAQTLPTYLPIASISCIVYIGQFAVAGWVLGKLEARYSTSRAK